MIFFLSFVGNKKAAAQNLKPASVDDSSVGAVIKKQGLNGVKIQLNLNEQVAERLNDVYEVDHPELVLSKHLEDQREKVEKRKYTLEELEVEGFTESNSSSKNSDFEEEEEVDLNSLIEGDVDEIDEELGKDSNFSIDIVENKI